VETACLGFEFSKSAAGVGRGMSIVHICSDVQGGMGHWYYCGWGPRLEIEVLRSVLETERGKMRTTETWRGGAATKIIEQEAAESAENRQAESFAGKINVRQEKCRELFCPSIVLPETSAISATSCSKLMLQSLCALQRKQLLVTRIARIIGGASTSHP